MEVQGIRLESAPVVIGLHSAESLKNSGTENRKYKGVVKQEKKGGEVTTTVDFQLIKKPNLTIADVKCPICWGILYEPTTLPCMHSICTFCFLKHVDETSLSCPVCRKRVAVFSRNAKKNHTFLDSELWERIKLEFSEAVKLRECGDDFVNISSTTEPCRLGMVSEPSGVLYKELKSLLNIHEQDLEIERQQSEAASIDFIKKLQEEEVQIISCFERVEKEDYLLAKKLHEELNGGGINNFTIRKSERERKPSKRFEMELYELDRSTKRKMTGNSQRLRTKRLKSGKKVAKTTHRVESATSVLQNLITKDAKYQSSDESDSSDVAGLPKVEVAGSSHGIEAAVVVQPDNSIEEEYVPHCSTNIPKPVSETASSTVAFSMFDKNLEIIPPSDEEDGPANVVTEDSMSDSIDYEQLDQEAQNVERQMQSLMAIEADRRFAMDLQKCFNLGIDDRRGRNDKNKYKLRSWK